MRSSVVSGMQWDDAHGERRERGDGRRSAGKGLLGCSTRCLSHGYTRSPLDSIPMPAAARARLVHNQYIC
jgi:hypothetical protein